MKKIYNLGLRFLCLSIKTFTVCAVKHFKDCSTKQDHTDVLFISIFYHNLFITKLDILAYFQTVMKFNRTSLKS